MKDDPSVKGLLINVNDKLDTVAEAIESLSARLEGIELAIAELDSKTRKSPGSEWCTVAEASQALSLDTSTIYRYIREGQYEPETQVKDIAPAGSNRPAYRLNVEAILSGDHPRL